MSGGGGAGIAAVRTVWDPLLTSVRLYRNTLQVSHREWLFAQAQGARYHIYRLFGAGQHQQPQQVSRYGIPGLYAFVYSHVIAWSAEDLLGYFSIERVTCKPSGIGVLRSFLMRGHGPSLAVQGEAGQPPQPRMVRIVNPYLQWRSSKVGICMVV